MNRIFLILVSILTSASFIICQDSYSSHSIRFFKNDHEKSIDISKLWISVNDEKIEAKKNDDTFWFPMIDSASTFYLFVKSNKFKFISGPYDAWRLNNGSRISLGKINRINRLLSVAEYNDMSREESDYEIFASRFFVVNKMYTIDIDDYNKVEKVEYLILNPYQEGDGSYVLTKRVAKYKR